MPQKYCANCKGFHDCYNEDFVRANGLDCIFYEYEPSRQMRRFNRLRLTGFQRRKKAQKRRQ